MALDPTPHTLPDRAPDRAPDSTPDRTPDGTRAADAPLPLDPHQRDQLCVNTIRFLAVDAVDKADSGHPGAPLGAAPMAYALWDRFLKHNPSNPSWPDRDRFVLSAGHASMLHYALLHLTGYDLPMEQVQSFRQWGSATPGHPEARHTPGIEVTTGPLGQGLGMAVGLAMAERWLAERFNTPPHRVVDHHTYVLASDGDLMEGVGSEAASLAGALRLGKLVVLYDDNNISIEGATHRTFREDVDRRFEAYGWHVQDVADGNDVEAVARALAAARAEGERPSLVRVRTHIGYGSPKQDTGEAHGSPLGAEATRATKRALGWPEEARFHVPDAALHHFRRAVEEGGRREAAWSRAMEAYRAAEPERARELDRVLEGRLPEGWERDLPVFSADAKGMATRKASGKVLAKLAGAVPELLGGSADLAPSTNTWLEGTGQLGFDPAGRNIQFGVREFAMAAAVNGMAMHGGVVPYAATFLIFSDYARPALRLAALMRARSRFVFTHDSIGLGEDGPTHQPVEHLMSLRAIPGFTLLRPADANETAAAWRVAMARDGPAALALTRQGVPVLDAAAHGIAEGVPRGAYVLSEARGGRPDVVLIGTGSEVHVCLAAQERLAGGGVQARVVSMPCWELFAEQAETYRQEVLPPGVPRLAVEAGATLGWERWVGDHGDIVGLDRFGASAPGKVVLQELGFTAERVAGRALALLERAKGRRAGGEGKGGA